MTGQEPSSEPSAIRERISLSPTAERLLGVLHKFAQDDPQGVLGDKIEPLEFMLRSVLAGRSDEEVRDSVKQFYDLFHAVLFDPLTEAESAVIVIEGNDTVDLGEQLVALLDAVPNVVHVEEIKQATAVHSDD